MAAKSIVYFTRTDDTEQQKFLDDSRFQVLAQVWETNDHAPTQPLSRFLLLQEGDPKELARLPVECAVDYY